MSRADDLSPVVMADGAVLKSIEEKRFLLLVGYSPNRLPKRGADGFQDLASPELVSKACWRFMLNGAKAGLGHRPGGEDAFKVVENYVYRGNDWVLKAPDGSTQTIRAGDWLVGIVCTPETWSAYKAGKFRSASLQGACRRGPVTPDLLARQRSN
jgi:hypothetical protein